MRTFEDAQMELLSLFQSYSDDELARIGGGLTTTIKKGPSFILPDGKIISVTDALKGEDEDFIIHSEWVYTTLYEIADNVADNDDEWDASELSMETKDNALDKLTYKRKWIHVNTGELSSENRFYMILPKGSKFNYKQLDAIEQFLNLGTDKVIIYFDDGNGYGYSTFRKEYSFQKYSVKDILGIIEDWSKSGELIEKKSSLKEADYSQEEKDFDYKTKPITNSKDVIDTSKTGLSFYDDLIPGSSENEYMRTHKNLQGEIIQMSPNEYYSECAKHIFHNHSEETLRKSRGEYDKEKVQYLQSVITDQKKKLQMPFIDYAKEGQEGLHRMFALGELYGWDEKFPVLKVTWADENRREYDLKYAYKKEVIDDIEDAIKETNYWTFDTMSKYIDELEAQLDKSFDNTWHEMHNEPLVKFSVEGKDDIIVIVVKDPDNVYDDVRYEYDVSDKEFKSEAPKDDDYSWVADSEIDDTDADDIDVDNVEFANELAKMGLSIDDFLKK